MTLAEALQKLHASGRIRSPWLPGMRALLDRGVTGGVTPFRRVDSGAWAFPSDLWLPNLLIDRNAEPDITDPATVGGLVALLREASADRHAYVMFASSVAAWVCNCRRLETGSIESYVSDGDAVAKALIALARALARDL